MIDRTDTNDRLTTARGLLVAAYEGMRGVPACPSWCVEDHTPHELLGRNFHHDGEPISLIPSPESLGLDDPTATGLHVKPSLFVPDAEAIASHGGPYTPQVEIQTDRSVVAVLTPADARSLAALLVNAADLAESS